MKQLISYLYGGEASDFGSGRHSLPSRFKYVCFLSHGFDVFESESFSKCFNFMNVIGELSEHQDFAL